MLTRRKEVFLAEKMQVLIPRYRSHLINSLSNYVALCLPIYITEDSRVTKNSPLSKCSLNLAYPGRFSFSMHNLFLHPSTRAFLCHRIEFLRFLARRRPEQRKSCRFSRLTCVHVQRAMHVFLSCVSRFTTTCM